MIANEELRRIGCGCYFATSALFDSNNPETIGDLRIIESCEEHYEFSQQHNAWFGHPPCGRSVEIYPELPMPPPVVKYEDRRPRRCHISGLYTDRNETPWRETAIPIVWPRDPVKREALREIIYPVAALSESTGTLIMDELTC